MPLIVGTPQGRPIVAGRGSLQERHRSCVLRIPGVAAPQDPEVDMTAAAAALTRASLCVLALAPQPTWGVSLGHLCRRRKKRRWLYRACPHHPARGLGW